MNQNIRGREIRIFLADGTASGVLIAALIGWTGKALVAPRSLLPDLIKREESSRTGVYFLLGRDPEGSGKDTVYIGEGDNVAVRLKIHNMDEKKDFFTRICLFTSTDDYLTKAHVKYLESHLIRMAKEADRVIINNNTEPTFTGLPEADQANMESYLENVSLLLPVLGFEMLKKITSPEIMKDTDITLFQLNQVGVQATAYEAQGEFIVQAGSYARKKGVQSWHKYSEDLRDILLKDGKLLEDADATKYRFSVDVPFTSPSAAATVVLARNTNGRTSWCVKGTKQTYADWQEVQIDREPED